MKKKNNLFVPSQVLRLLTVLIFTQTLQAQWVQTNGPYGVDVHCFAVDGLNLFAGTGSGVFLSTNNGSDWRWVSNGTNTPILSIAVNGENIYAVNGGVFHSTNNGENWINISQGIPNISFNSIVTKGNIIFAGSYWDGVYLSTNNGINWTQANNGLTNINVNSLLISGDNVFVGTNGGTYLSTNNGTNWTSKLNINVLSLFANGNNIYAGTYGGVYLSTNNGVNWVQLKNGLTNTEIRSIAVRGNNIYVGTPGGVFYSTNSGSDWIQLSNGLTDTDILSIGASGLDIFAGTNSGVFRSTNGGMNWVQVNNGLTVRRVHSLAFKNSNIYAGTSDGVHFTTDNGITWNRTNNGLPNTDIRALAVSGNNIFAGTDPNGIFLSTNSGINWTQVYFVPMYTQVQCLAVSDANILAGILGDGGGVFLSTNNGANWVQVNNGLTSTSVISLAVSGTNIFAGAVEGVFLSTNNGANWAKVNNGLTNTYVWSIAVSGTNIFAGTNDGVFLSTNNGANWVKVNNGLTNTYVKSLAVSDTNILAGTNSGIFLSTNNGTVWTEINDGLLGKTTYALNIRGNDIFAGIFRLGVWKRSLIDMFSNITVLQPNGGEVLQTGAVQKIMWTSNNVKNVKIEYSANNGTDWEKITENTPDSSGNFSWPIPNISSTQCLVRISDVSNSSIYDKSNNIFTIEPQDTTATVLKLNNITAQITGDSIIIPLDVNNFNNIGAITLRIQYDPSVLSFGRGLNFARTGFLINSPQPGLINIDFADLSPINITSGKLLDLKFLYKGGNSAVKYLTPQCEIADINGNVLKVVYIDGSIVTNINSNVDVMPHSFNLFQNYPNPFNPATTIRYGLPSNSRVSLKLYNVLGQQIADLVNTEQSAGWYETTWNANVSSGLYFYRIDAVSTADPLKRFSQLKKMILLK